MNKKKFYYDVYQYVNAKNPAANGKYYARVHSLGTLDLDDVCQHIMDHGSMWTDDVVTGVIKKFRKCLIEILSESYKVKIAGLGTFYVGLNSEPADTVGEFSDKNITGASIRLMPDLSPSLGMASPSFIKKLSVARMGVAEPSEDQP